MKSTYFIVADRGHLKAFRAEKMPAGRPLHLELINSLDLVSGQRKVSEKLEDQAGRFPVGAGPASGKGGGNGRHQNSVAEKHYELEDTRRLTRELAEHIGAILRQDGDPAWFFAAPAAIKNAVVEELAPHERARMEECIAADLVKVDPTELPAHFPSLAR
jgi:hypothetical protein